MSDISPRYLKDYQAPDYLIESVELTVELDDTATLVTNKMHLRVNGCHQRPLILDGEHLTLLSVELDGTTLSPEQYQLSKSQLVLNSDFSNKTFTLSIQTQIDPKANTALEGIYKSGDVYCSQCEAEGFRRISYFLDRPDVMAVYTTKIIANKQQYPYLLANGNAIARGDLSDGKHFVTWHDPFPKPSYLFALVAGNFDLLADTFTTRSGREVTLELFVDQGNLSKAEHAMTSLKKSMQWDEQEFNLEYDLDVYMIVAVDFFNMGAMENKGLNIFNSKYVLADDSSATDDDFFNVEAVIAHEYFHNWTGNRVTCRDWFQLSLKEGLTVFRDQQFSADMHSKAVTRIKNVRVLRSQQFAEDAGPMAHPIRPEKVLEMNNFYTLTVYEKGAEVIRMLHTLLGDKAFKAGIALYFERHDGQAVTCDEFVNALSDASGRDLSQFKLWYSQSGTPKIEVTDSFDPKSKRYQITLTQLHAKTHDQEHKKNLHIPVNYELINPMDKSIIASGMWELTEQTHTFVFDNMSSAPVPALLANFSAPVKLSYPYTEEQTETLIFAAEDEFIRWEASQQFYRQCIRQLVNEPNASIPRSLVTMVETVLNSDADRAFKAEQIKLPSFDEMADCIDFVVPADLLTALEKVKVFIANKLQPVFIKVYQDCQLDTFSKDATAIGKRALKNACLEYLATSQMGNEIVLKQFQQADNMTDQLAAFRFASVNDLACFEHINAAFEQQWQDNSLVMDKWFTVNAMHQHEQVIERVRGLLSHPKFSLENPNKARSLIGAFAFYNPKYFHQEDGQGYAFLQQQIAILNGLNPQVASRIITPLIQFKSFSKTHQKLMKSQLELLANLDDLSNDLQEKLSSALN
ncbi:aminopeptidase N [Thalassotalea aquiviva]|uniref:aminopeptidase N n=1 Tax=Thalassotalea aquiviva TaxID=3242415 RepID=UPI00352AFE04